jgi:signal transduction histidine kinase
MPAGGNGNGASAHRESAEDLIALYDWLSIPRFLTVAVAGGAVYAFWLAGAIDFDPAPILFVLIPTFVAASATSSLLIRKLRRFGRPILYGQLGLDVAAITVGVLLTGASRSPFIPLYLLVVISAGLVSVWATAVLGAIASLLYVSMVLGDRAGIFPLLPRMSYGFERDAAFSVIVFVLIIALIAFQSWFYVRSIRRKDEQLLALKDEFLFRTIHDLRAPSTVIKLVLAKLGEDPKLFAAYPDAKSDVALMNGALERMTGLIEDLLKIGRGEQAAFAVERKPVDLPAVIGRIVAESGPAAAERRVTVSYDGGAAVPALGDASLLQQVFANFIDNAIKYNVEGGSVRVDHAAEGGRLLTRISDTGIGISPESLRKLFSPYFRGDVGREIQGTGLGLYMTKKLVEKMDGSIDVVSSKGKGSTFTVVLPLASGRG